MQPNFPKFQFTSPQNVEKFQFLNIRPYFWKKKQNKKKTKTKTKQNKTKQKKKQFFRFPLLVHHAGQPYPIKSVPLCNALLNQMEGAGIFFGEGVQISWDHKF